MLTASGSIIIDRPLKEIWDFVTTPGVRRSWVDEQGSYLLSDWKPGSKIVYKYSNGEDNYRGHVERVEPYKYILFYIHDAYAEDQYNKDPEYGIDWVDEEWELSFEEVDPRRTKFTLYIGDYDAEHTTDDAHDHEQVIAIYEQQMNEGIPNSLQRLKKMIVDKK